MPAKTPDPTSLPFSERALYLRLHLTEMYADATTLHRQVLTGESEPVAWDGWAEDAWLLWKKYLPEPQYHPPMPPEEG